MTKQLTIDILGYWGGFPKANEATAGVFVYNQDTRVLIDCGSGVISKYLEHYDVFDLDAVILSHLHADHSADLKILQYKMNNALRTQKRNNKLKIYMPKSPELYFQYNQDEFTSDIETYDTSRILNIGSLKFSFFENVHTIEAYSMNIETQAFKVSYVTDTEYQRGLIDFVKEANLLICGATKTEGSTHSSGVGHMSDFEAGQLATAGHVEQLVLFHLPSDGKINTMISNAQSRFEGTVTAPNINKKYVLESTP